MLLLPLFSNHKVVLLILLPAFEQMKQFDLPTNEVNQPKAGANISICS
jgi:hypothetical protein